jgi:hypothetical protein
MKRIFAFMLVMTWVSTGTIFAAQQTWTGVISDSQCGANHSGEVNEHDCTLQCIKAGFEYVLVADGKILKIANQKFPALKERAGNTVKLSGEMKGGAIVVSGIKLQPKPK